ncbi:MAG TPA: APC family permease [Candidatus Acidoferrales bacterium]|nr:APC family permease [Candidatus Acidoferrales bacterium]
MSAASPAPANPASPAPSTPRRVLGLRDLVFYYLVTGISLRWISFAAAGGASVLLVWIGAWFAFALPLILSVLALSSRYPQEGGLYLWSRIAFGEFGGFMAGWTYWTSNLPYFPTVLYFAAGSGIFLTGNYSALPPAAPVYFIAFSLAALLFITLLNVRGLESGTWINNLGAAGMWIPILVLVGIAVALLRSSAPATHFSAASLVPRASLQDAIFWSAITFALCGCEAASFMGDEIENPRRNVPRALLAGSLLSVLGYMIGTVAILLILPSRLVDSLEGLPQAVAAGAARLGISGVLAPVALLIVVSNVGAASAFLAACSRVPFVAGLDRYLPEAFGRLHPRFGTPHVSLWFQFAAAAVFVFLGQAGTSVEGAYNVLVSMTVITTFIPYLFLFASVVRLAPRLAESTQPAFFRLPGGPIVVSALALLGFATTLVCILLSLVPSAAEPNKPLAVLKVAGLSFLLLAAGVAAYAGGIRHAHPA